MNELSQLKIIEFFNNYTLSKYSAKEIIYSPEEKIDHVAFVKTGYVRIYNHDLSGKEITYSGFKPVFYMSYLFAYKNIPNQYYFQALTELEVWKAPLVDFKKFLSNNSNVATDMVEIILDSFHEVLLSWENSLSGDAYFRIGKLLLTLSKDYGKKENNGSTIDFHTTHQLIASMLGITRETASIQIKKLENNGLITQKTNTIIINDMDKMTKTFL
ncbi:MAG: Crp/Fnr family transcriptional regulator [Candidatus Shapirobacteria bacterium]